MLSPRHEPLVDDLCSIVSARLDMDAFLDDGVAAGAEGLAGLVATWLDLRRLRHGERGNAAAGRREVGERVG